MFLLDTDTCIHLARGNVEVLEHLRAKRRSDIHLSVLSVYEMELGILKAARQVVRKRDALQSMIDLFTIASFDLDEAETAAKIRSELEKKGQPIGAIDYLIAGTARAHGWTLVTGNVREFQRVKSLKVEDWIR